MVCTRQAESLPSISCRSQNFLSFLSPSEYSAWSQGGMIAAGGWTETQDGWNEISHTAVWYDPTSASWVQIENLRKGRTQFALETVNGTMTAIGGFDVSVVCCVCLCLLGNALQGIYTESIEQLGPDGGNKIKSSQNK